ncbi:hypothetical protein Blon_1737 [Bifidobacterium longum subsp. infantis ATCC 15697 = JCM 1222 = DSM 20088]|uniref:Uncharacterized protein n=1 Tax=Bifidobacterium longum subsp. infantis (strain ATCC 15697 / DSM 20088 / JCM 1222 / NCTC 11817 / S12) TaxID=391904 RepID=B7GSY2_BIFLS|nr:hypothetical protein Blon_1737 [Bifidobacterium longum subsp. infantis ATCC 15697 = JCM 1222 = DSM 20088]
MRLGGLHGTRGYEYAPPEKGAKPAGRGKSWKIALVFPALNDNTIIFAALHFPCKPPQGLASTRYSIWRNPLPKVTVSSVFLLQPEIIVGVGFLAPYVFLCNRCNGCNR